MATPSSSSPASSSPASKASVLAEHGGGLDSPARARIRDHALQLAGAARQGAGEAGFALKLVHRFGLGTPQGIALLQLAESLPRTRDAITAHHLIADKLGGLTWPIEGRSTLMERAAVVGLNILSHMFRAHPSSSQLNAMPTMLQAIARRVLQTTIQSLSSQYVLAESLAEAERNGRELATMGYDFSYDMLGEAALTETAALSFQRQYLDAVQFLGAHNQRHTLSVKLSALHPRFEERQRARTFPILMERILAIAVAAKQASLPLTIDAEESERLDFTLDIFTSLARSPALSNWNGLGLAVQAYRREALSVVDRLAELASETGRRFSVRLVKGAYWDTEIKRAQQLGLDEYPVFTRKCDTDLNYLACARRLLSQPDRFFPQFATHNAYSAAAVVELAQQLNAPFEFQRLHGMGEHLHAALLRAGFKSRIYAPIGPRRDLLPYLVRRLLENGAGNSFVRQLTDSAVPLERLVDDPLTVATATTRSLRAPRQLPMQAWPTAQGWDVANRSVGLELMSALAVRQAVTAATGQPIRNPANKEQIVGYVTPTSPAVVALGVNTAISAHANWSSLPSRERADILIRAADLLEKQSTVFIRLAVLEAGKTLDDAVSEVREAIDFCRYYADQSCTSAFAERHSLGVVACISPWNFPLAIFLGQVVGSLAAGNAVIAKPAEQTPLIAIEAVRLLHEAGVPPDALQLVIGDGALGAALTSNPKLAAVCFTGSVATAKAIGRTLIAGGHAALPFIAETGGINAMIVDSSALPEQVVRDVLTSAFQSAGQRCSALRVLCLQNDCADRVLNLLHGALEQLQVGDPCDLTTDIGPLIDAEAYEHISAYLRGHPPSRSVTLDAAIANRGWFVAPSILEVARVSEVKQEIFGPVLHVVRFAANELPALIDEINSQGYGLTLGVHTRIDTRATFIAERAHVGNVYVNRHQVGAVVNQQPFGGHGLSGTGPKAGGPHYLLRLSKLTAAHRSNAATISLDAPSPQAQQSLRSVRAAFKAGPHRPRPVDAPAHVVGEDNRLFLRPRGVVLCIVQSNSAHHIQRSVEAGNGVVVATPPQFAAAILKAVAELEHKGMNRGQVAVVDLPDTRVPMSWLDLDVDAVAFDGDFGQAHQIAAKLHTREGAIVPVILNGDDAYRYSVEQTVTVNTAAAGGDPQLLAASAGT